MSPTNFVSSNQASELTSQSDMNNISVIKQVSHQTNTSPRRKNKPRLRQSSQIMSLSKGLIPPVKRENSFMFSSKKPSKGLIGEDFHKIHDIAEQ
jgi:hypothetical protein